MTMRTVWPLEAVKARYGGGEAPGFEKPGMQSVRYVLSATPPGHDPPNSIAAYERELPPEKALRAIPIDPSLPTFEPWVAYVTETSKPGIALPGRLSLTQLAAALGIPRSTLGNRMARWRSAQARAAAPASPASDLGGASTTAASVCWTCNGRGVEGGCPVCDGEPIVVTTARAAAPASPDTAGGVVPATSLPVGEIKLDCVPERPAGTIPTWPSTADALAERDEACQRIAELELLLAAMRRTADGAINASTRACTDFNRIGERAILARQGGCSDASALGYIEAIVEGWQDQ